MRSSSNLDQAVSIVVVITAVALQWYSHEGGLITTPDSCNYLSAAFSFKTSSTLLSPDGSAYTYWPPLLPVLLSLFGNPEKVLLWVHLIVTAWVGFIVIALTRRFITNPVLRYVCVVSIVGGVHLLMVGVFLWTELVFILVLFYFISSAEKSVESRSHFILAIVLGSVLCLLRNAGMFIVSAVAVWYWLQASWSFKQKLAHSIILFVVGSSTFWLWNIYNSATVSGFELGDHEYFQWLAWNFHVMAYAMVQAFVPLPWFGSLLLLSALGLLWWILREELRIKPLLQLWAVAVLIYLAGMASLFRLDFYDGDRYVFVILPFFTILVFRGVELVMARQTSRLKNVLLVVVCCWLVYPMARTIKNARQWHEVSFGSKCESTAANTSK